MKKHRIITLGYAGGQICNTLLLKGVDAGCLEHFGTDPIQSGYLIIKDKFVLRKSKVGVESTDYKVMDELFKTYLDEFKQVIEPNICYFLVCGLGGRTGAGLAVNLTKLLIEQKKEFSYWLLYLSDLRENEDFLMLYELFQSWNLSPGISLFLFNWKKLGPKI